MIKLYALILFLFAFHKISLAQWQQLDVPTTNNIRSSSFVNDSVGWIGFENATSTITLYQTINGGETWSSVSIPGVSYGTSYVNFVSETKGFAVINGEAFKTTDGGSTWNQMSISGLPNYEPYFLNEDTGFIAGEGEVFKTIDGGETWIGYPTDYSGINFWDMHFRNDSVGYASEYDGYIWSTYDGGQTWLYDIDGGLWDYFYAVYFKPDGTFTYTGYEDVLGDYTSYIAGAGFSSQDVGDLYDLKWFTNDRGYSVGEYGWVVYTDNGGLVWDEVKPSDILDEPDYSFWCIDGIHDIYVFGDHGSGYKRADYCSAAPAFTFSVSELVVQFTDQSANATEWYWDFGDGTSSTEQDPVHTYSDPGIYSTCLVVGASGCSSDPLCHPIITCTNTSLATAGALDINFDDDGFAMAPNINSYSSSFQSIAIQADHKILAGGSSALLRFNIDGTIDSSFGDDGVVQTDGILFRKMALAPDGKILSAEESSTDINVVRYNEDGSPDSTFDGDGLVITDVSQINDYNDFYDVTVQPDGKPVVFGYYSDDSKYPTIVRYNSDGSLDNTFTGDGIANIAIDAFAGGGAYSDIIVQDDGKIVFGAAEGNTGNYHQFLLCRLNSDGTVDSTFGEDGIVITEFSDVGYAAYITKLLYQNNGKLIATGQVNEHFALMRFNDDGSVDSTFGEDGVTLLQFDGFNSYATSSTLQPDGKIIMCGYAYTNPTQERIALVRLTEDGQIDSSFGNYGTITTRYACAETNAYDISLDANSIYVAGGIGDYPSDFCIVRYLNDACALNANFSFETEELTAQFSGETDSSTSWQWDFGDGNNSTEQNPLHNYAAEGTYSVCLTTTGNCGSTSLCQSVTVCEPLNTDYLFYQDNLEVHFSNLANTADSAYWDFGDGVTSTLTSPTHDYDYSGTYTACLYEFDVCGDVDTMCKDITVCGQLESNFSYSPNGNSIQFTDLSENSEGRTWDFGDGFTDTLKNPTHVYDLPGDYDACIHSFNECESDSFCQEISILATTSQFNFGSQSFFNVFPNPVSSTATISFSFNEDSKILIELFSVDGKKVMTIANENFSEGKHEIGFSRMSLAAGIYFLHLKTMNETFSGKLLLE